jgi:hypothetical protein
MFRMDRHAWHFTRGENLERIFRTGHLLCDSQAQPVVTVGNAEIKAARAARGVPILPGGVVADYVPFYFGPRRPMFVSVVDKRADGWRMRQRGLVYFVTSPERLAEEACSVIYTDRNARLALASFADDGAECPIDWQLVDSDDWQWIPQQDDWKARCQAELLVHQRVPLNCIELIGVADERVQARVEGILTDCSTTIPVQVRRGWYLA